MSMYRILKRALRKAYGRLPLAFLPVSFYNEVAKSNPALFPCLFGENHEGGFVMQSGVQFHSSDPVLNTRFDWARKQALAYVHDHAPIGPVYEAALPGREAFCMRDVAHHAAGAHALSLDEHNYTMLRRFALGISESRSYCSYWEITFDGRPCPVDYLDDTDFWYNLPANFDVMDACLRMYNWTGDSRYLFKEEFRHFYRMSVEDYIRHWDRDHDGVMERQQGTGRCGIASYDESPRQKGYKVAADLLAAEFRGLLTYADMLHIVGEHVRAKEYEQKAQRLQDWFEDAWWSEKEQAYAAVWFGGDKFGFEYMGTVEGMPLYFGLIRDPKRQQKQLDYILKNSADCVEEFSYHAEIFWRYGLNGKAREAFLAMTNPDLKRREYPEISYAAIGAIVTGLMGIRPNAAEGVLHTRSTLNSGEFAQVNHLPLWGGEISLLHEGRERSTLFNQTARPVSWMPEGAKAPIAVAAGETKASIGSAQEANG